MLTPTGMLGAGISPRHVQFGIERGAHAIALDSGSTDSGPAYLAKAVSKTNREAIKRDLEVLMAAAHQARIPILIGSCGTSGTDAGVDWTTDIAVEVAKSLGIAPRIALLYSEQSPAVIMARNAAGKVRPLPPAGLLADATIVACQHIVALMGAEPYMAALDQGRTLCWAAVRPTRRSWRPRRCCAEQEQDPPGTPRRWPSAAASARSILAPAVC